MFEFQPCHYYERFSQFFAYYVRKTPRNQMPKKLPYFIQYNVVLKYIHVKKTYITTYGKMKTYLRNG
jgi:hypothetical protein